MSEAKKLKVGAFRKCIHSMTDRQLVGIGRACHSLSQNAFSYQFAECKREWELRDPCRSQRVAIAALT
jgi:hypothetical protein